MDWLKQWNEALDYLEEHLLEEVSLETLGRIACCGGYHFQRMFSYLAGVPLSEYIRRRRMTLAAAELRGGARVIDTALRYGYESPTAFNRAFQSVHGLPPSAVRRDGAVLRNTILSRGRPSGSWVCARPCPRTPRRGLRWFPSAGRRPDPDCRSCWGCPRGSRRGSWV